MPPPRAPRPLGVRAEGDRCPGAVRLFAADDGLIARIRLPGGRVTAAQLAVVAGISAALGDGRAHITSRGSVQVRGLAEGSAGALARRLTAAGLLPAPDHDRIRNVVASPLAGCDGRGRAPVDPVVAELDRLLCTSADLTELSGRFLFAVDDGRGDVLALGPDLAAVADDEHVFRLWVGARPTGAAAPAAEAAALLVRAAAEFLTLRAQTAPRAWRVADLGAAAARLGAPAPTGAAGGPPPRAAPPPLGLVPSPGAGAGVAVSVGLPLGSAGAAAWEALAEVARHAVPPAGGAPVRVTPWRGVVVVGLTRRRAAQALATLRDAGLVVTDTDPLARIGACTGRPGCGSARSDVRRDVVEALPSLGARDPAYPLYVAGCDRRCGHPAGARVEAVATGEGRYGVVVHHADGRRDTLAAGQASLTDVPPS